MLCERKNKGDAAIGVHAKSEILWGVGGEEGRRAKCSARKTFETAKKGSQTRGATIVVE